MNVIGADAGLFLLDIQGCNLVATSSQASLNQILIPVGGSLSLTVHCLGHQENVDAALDIMYGGDTMFLIGLSTLMAKDDGTSNDVYKGCWNDSNKDRVMGYQGIGQF
ncbi:hypothetical protein ACA910_008400 [Epithemia clementina (nom. ined.)]